MDSRRFHPLTRTFWTSIIVKWVKYPYYYTVEEMVSSVMCEPERIDQALVAQMVKNLLTTQETWVRSLGREDPLEKEVTTPSSILAWRIPLTEEPDGLQSMGSRRVGHSWVTKLTYLSLQQSSKKWREEVMSHFLRWGTFSEKASKGKKPAQAYIA